MVLGRIRFVPPIFLVVKKDTDTLSVTMFVFGVIVIEVWDSDLPLWGFICALLIGALSRQSS